MYRSRAVVAALLTLGLMATAAPAMAQGLTVSDPAGDTLQPGLDMTNVSLSNRDHAYVAALTFVEDREGSVIVAVETRDKVLYRMITKHRSHGADKTYLLNRRSQTVPCSGLSSTWDRTAATLQLRMPAACLHGGDYGDVRSWALTEPLRDGRDVDYAPENTQGELTFTDWIPRG